MWRQRQREREREGGKDMRPEKEQGKRQSEIEMWRERVGEKERKGRDTESMCKGERC